MEYVRGIPVVKTFGQSVFSFKKFKTTIDEYEKWVISYTKDLRLPMMFYTAAVNGVFAFLIAGGLLFTTHGVTASLDVENETAIQEALSRLIKNKTVLIIAHRMRTVAGADQVVVLSGGIVAEQGSPAELYARKGLYTHMVDLQSASQNWTI